MPEIVLRDAGAAHDLGRDRARPPHNAEGVRRRRSDPRPHLHPRLHTCHRPGACAFCRARVSAQRWCLDDPQLRKPQFDDLATIARDALAWELQLASRPERKAGPAIAAA